MAAEPTITCPTCRAEIKLTESLAAPLIEATRQQYERRLSQQTAEMVTRPCTSHGAVLHAVAGRVGH